MRVRLKGNVIVTQATDGRDKLFAPDDQASELVLDGFTEQSSGQVALAAGGTFVVPLGGLSTVGGVYLKASGDFTVQFGAGTPFAIKRGQQIGTVASSARLLAEANVASVQIVATTALTLVWCLWGDPSV